MGICDCLTNQNKNPNKNINALQQSQGQNIITNPNPQMIPSNQKKENENVKEIIPYFIESENKYKNFELINTTIAHNDNITCLIELHNKKIMTGSNDKTIKIWNLNDISQITCEKIILNKEKVICLLEFEPDFLLIGEQSENIILMNINKPDEQKIYFKGHLLYVNCLIKLNEKYFASASNDTEIRIWDYFQRVCVNVLSGHELNIFCLIKLNNDKICSAGNDKVIKIWNWKENKLEANLTGNKSWIKSLLYLKNKNIILSGSDDGIIKYFENNKDIKEIKAHENSVKYLCNINERYIASCSFDKSIKIWDLNEGNCVQNLNGHLDKVICLLYHSDGYLISCSNDKTFIIWKQDKNTPINLNTNLY